MNKSINKAINQSLIWVGGAICLAELLTGTYYADLGFFKGLLAIVLGHTIGAVFFYLVGLMGAKTKKSSMELTRSYFGDLGCNFFTVLNILQLIGWSAFMIYDGAIAANSIIDMGFVFWCILSCILIITLVTLGLKDLGWLNRIAMGALFILTIVIFGVILSSKVSMDAATKSTGLSFGKAIELSISMPISWLPVIADYSREYTKPKLHTFLSVGTYTIFSCWMFVVGMVAAIYTGTSDIAGIMVKSGLGIVALSILVLSTATSSFIDCYSSAVDFESISKKVPSKVVGVIVAVVATLMAIFAPLNDMSNFLYIIASVFTPLAAIEIARFFLLKKRESKKTLTNIIIWIFGFILYQELLKMDMVLGASLADMLCVMVVTIFVGLIERKKEHK